MTAPQQDDPTLQDAHVFLNKCFNFPAFRPGQRQVISHLLSTQSPDAKHGRSLAIFPTGAGKSLCYQIPALLFRTGITIVVSPLIALMKDQVDSLRAKQQPAACLDSSLSALETRQLFEQVRNGDIKLLFVSPERFKNDRFMRLIRSIPVALFAVDEAHCISEWGHTFRPDYLRLARWANRLNCQRRLALTATATPAVESDICRALDIPHDAVVRTASHRPNLTTRVTSVPPNSPFHERISLLVSRLRERPAGPTIVYVTLQSTASTVAEMLRERGFHQAQSYHAGMRPDDRKRVQEQFMANVQDAIVVATIAFGMGLDHSSIRYVYHLNLPKSLEGYIQEIGRAGRDGLPSICETFASVDDVSILEAFIYGETPSRSDVRGLLHKLLDDATVGEHVEYSMYDLSYEHDIRDTCLGQVLAQLDISENIMEESTPFYAQLDCRLPRDRSRVPPANSRGAKILKAGLRKTSFVYVDIREVALELDMRYGEISRVCDDMVNDGYLDEVRPKKLMHRALIKSLPTDMVAVADRLHARLRLSEKRQLKRLREVLKYFSANECQTSYLRRHLGELVEETGVCGHCEFSLSGCKQPVNIVAEMGARVAKSLDSRKWANVLGEISLPRDNALLLARFAAGITSPVISRKYKKLSTFGSMSDHDFKTLMKAAEEECGARK